MKKKDWWRPLKINGKTYHPQSWATDKKIAEKIKNDINRHGTGGAVIKPIKASTVRGQSKHLKKRIAHARTVYRIYIPSTGR